MIEPADKRFLRIGQSEKILSLFFKYWYIYGQ